MRPPRLELTRGGVLLSVQVIDRTIYLDEGGSLTHEGHFDAEEAQAATAALIEARLADGWVETDESRGRREAVAAHERALHEQLARHEALAAAPNPAAAFTEHLAPLAAASAAAAAALTRVAGFVEGIEEPTPFGFLVRLRGGGGLRWSVGEEIEDAPPALAALLAHVGAFWLYRNARELDDNNHTLYFGDDADPPESDQELHDTPLRGAAIAWFLQELPWDRYWFVANGSVWSYQFDGGLSEDLGAPPLAEVVLQRIAHHLEGR